MDYIVVAFFYNVKNNDNKRNNDDYTKSWEENHQKEWKIQKYEEVNK